MQVTCLVSKVISRVGDCRASLNCHVRIVTVVGIEGRNTCRRVIIVSELCQGQPFMPIILLISAIDANVLFKSLIDPFGLPICLGMISSRDFAVDNESATKR